MNLTIGIRYSCPQCGLKDVEVRIPARTTEDVLDWMNDQVTPGLGADHGARSPNCHPETLRDVKIPMTGVDRIGGAPVQ